MPRTEVHGDTARRDGIAVLKDTVSILSHIRFFENRKTVI
jgi:hypothetical protein